MPEPIFICMQCPYCLGYSDLTVPRDCAPGEGAAVTALPKMVGVPGTPGHEQWGRLAAWLEMPLTRLAQLASEGHLLPLVIAKLEGR